MGLAWLEICVHQAWALLFPWGHSRIRQFKLGDGFLQVCATFKTYVFRCFCNSFRPKWRLGSPEHYVMSLAWSEICVHQAWALLITLGRSRIRWFKLGDGFLQVCATFKTSVFRCVCLSSRPWWRLRSPGQYAVSLTWSVICVHQAWALLISLGHSGIRRFKLSNGFLQVCTTFKNCLFSCVCFSSRPWWRLRSLGQYAMSLAWAVMCFHQAWALLFPCDNTGVRGFEFCNGFLQVCATFRNSVFRCVCFFCCRHLWRHRSLG